MYVKYFLEKGGEKIKSEFQKADKKSDIVIFDEPTANLDTYSGRIFYGLLEKIVKDSFVIVVSHDNNAIQYFDNIINL